MTELADRRDQRDPTTVGLQILSREDRSIPAHVEADKVLKVSNNGTGK